MKRTTTTAADPSATWIALGGIALLGGALLACKKSEGASSEAPKPAPTFVPAPAVEKKEPTLGELLLAQPTLTGAISVMRPHFKDTANENDPAAAVFAVWAMEKMTWSELQTIPETKHALIMKDSEAERGKRNCYTGIIIEIEVDRSGGKPVYLGGLMTNGGQVARFVAVGSTGDLVQKSGARFCGIVTGKQSYSNSGGGTTHAVYLVGMFDLPDNKPKSAK